jgi:hypothetical protein
LLSENKNDFAYGSLTNYCYFVFSHLHGVYPPKINPFYDFTNNKVGDLPTQCYLNDAL